MRKKKEYSDYLAMLHEKAARAPDRVRFTGFVPEHQLPFIFAAADVVVLPYTRAISSSGPLSLCVAYNKPFLASESLKEIINEPAIMFPNTAEGIGKIINSFINDDFLKERARLYSLSLLHDRRWENVALKTAQIYNKIAQSYGVVDKPEPSIPVMDFVSFEESSVFDELFSSRPPKNI